MRMRPSGALSRDVASARQVQFLNDASGALGEGKGGRHCPHGMGAAAEQLAAQRRFQRIDSPRHGGGRQAMPARGSGKAAAFEHVDEEFELSGKGVWQHRVTGLCVICKAIVRGCAYRRQRRRRSMGASMRLEREHAVGHRVERIAGPGPGHARRTVRHRRRANRDPGTGRAVRAGSATGAGYGTGDGGAQRAARHLALSPAQSHRLAPRGGAGRRQLRLRDRRCRCGGVADAGRMRLAFVGFLLALAAYTLLRVFLRPAPGDGQLRHSWPWLSVLGAGPGRRAGCSAWAVR